MTVAEKCLVWLVRVNALLAVLAIFAVFLPLAWMQQIHRGLGMGELPSAPIVAYLARSLSLFYAMGGSVGLLAATDLHRYRPIIRLMAYCMLATGGASLVIDARTGLPWYWTFSEGPYGLLVGGCALHLLRRIPLRR